MVARLEICDIINEVEIGAKDSIKYLKKKLTTKAHPAVLVKTLLVLETCTKNCGRRFHLQLADRSFMDQLAKLVVGKNALGGLVRKRVLVAVSTVPRATYNHGTPMQIEPPLSVESGWQICRPLMFAARGPPVYGAPLSLRHSRASARDVIRCVIGYWG